MWAHLMFVVACATGQSPTHTAPKAEPAQAVVPDPPSRLDLVPTDLEPAGTVDAECMQDCTRQNMARAVAAEVIEADCRRACGAAKNAAHPADENALLPPAEQ